MTSLATSATPHNLPAPPVFIHVVFTGGPGGGKSTAVAAIPGEIEARGYGVLTVPEAATILIEGGFPIREALAAAEKGDMRLLWAFQKAITRTQHEQRRIAEDLAVAMHEATGKRFVIIHDRGIADNGAYVGTEKFNQLLYECEIDLFQARDRYDVVIHLVTAADGAEEFYTLDNNAARTETPELARELDKKTRAAWHGHEHFKVIDNSTSFERKINRVKAEILNALQEPPTERERKFLLSAMPADELLADAVQTDMLQTYLLTADDTELRIRQSTQGTHQRWSRTTKGPEIAPGERPEHGATLDERTYYELLAVRDPKLGTVEKRRYSFTTGSQYFELDLFLNPDGVILLEAEVASMDDEVVFPDWLQALIVREVTDDPAYKTRALAAKAS